MTPVSQMLEPGTLLAERYRIVRMIGVGGMGAVFEAENIVTHKRVAIKWLQPLIAERPEAAARLLREAQAASRVRHPNVVDVYDVVRDGDTMFLVLELLEGEPLEHVFERESLPLPQLLRVLVDAMRGVAAAHKHGVIHRDMHPGNIFVMRQPDTGRYTAKVLDFGISKLAGSSNMEITQPGMTLGTPLYMSFEQLRGEANIDFRADIYAFGVILYEALTGRLPFEAGSLPELAIKFATSAPTPVRALRPAVPESLDRAIAAALARDRDQRLYSVEPLIREVEAFAAVLESRTKSAEDLLGLREEAVPPHQIVTLGRRVTPANDAPLEAPHTRSFRTGQTGRFAMSWTVTLLGAFAAAVLSASVVIAVRGARREAEATAEASERPLRASPGAEPVRTAAPPAPRPIIEPIVLHARDALAEMSGAPDRDDRTTVETISIVPTLEPTSARPGPARRERALGKSLDESAPSAFRAGRPPSRDDF